MPQQPQRAVLLEDVQRYARPVQPRPHRCPGAWSKDHHPPSKLWPHELRLWHLTAGTESAIELHQHRASHLPAGTLSRFLGWQHLLRYGLGNAPRGRWDSLCAWGLPSAIPPSLSCLLNYRLIFAVKFDIHQSFGSMSPVAQGRFCFGRGTA